MAFVFDADRSSILSYLDDPELPTALLESFFAAALEYADESPWRRLGPTAHFPILLTIRALRAAGAASLRRLALILGGAETGGDAIGLVLTDALFQETEVRSPSPSLVVIYAGYPDADASPILWRGRPVPRTRLGLLPWPTVHDLDDRVRAPRRAEILLLTAGLLAVRRFVRSYPLRDLDDRTAQPHECDMEVNLAPGGYQVRAAVYPVPH